VQEAIKDGATVLQGGAVPAGPGVFYPPTVWAGCTDEMVVMRKETFGPVAPVLTVGCASL
jgi:succinate-semialdehyde dehydrogenase/glutarate-semialdehyde dehydrogenase